MNWPVFTGQVLLLNIKRLRKSRSFPWAFNCYTINVLWYHTKVLIWWLGQVKDKRSIMLKYLINVSDMDQWFSLCVQRNNDIAMPVKVCMLKRTAILCTTAFDAWETTICIDNFQLTEMTDHTNACWQIQNFANNLEIENSRNKDHAKIPESTIPYYFPKRGYMKLLA